MPCGCEATRCSCEMASGAGLEISGTGSAKQPYKLEAILRELTGFFGSSIEVTVTGTGVVGDPWVVSMETTGEALGATIYAANDTWTKPSAGTIVQVICIGGGGGGAMVLFGNGVGGAGGNGGSLSRNYFAHQLLPDSVTITVGQGGAGAVDGGATLIGGKGGDSFFGPYLGAAGGQGGNYYKQQGISPPPPTISGTPPEGGRGGPGSDVGNLAPDAYSAPSPRGGGRGGGVNFTPTTGGLILTTDVSLSGEGGDGATSIAVNGGDGNLYGGGGGGGAIDGSFNQSDRAGNGADGIVIVTVW